MKDTTVINLFLLVLSFRLSSAFLLKGMEMKGAAVEVEGSMEDDCGNSVTLEDLRRKMAEFAKERDWDQFHSPRNLLLALVIISFFLFSFWVFDSIICSPLNKTF